MKKNQKPKKLISDGNHQLLSVKELMDTLLKETEGLPAELKQAIVQARNIAWQSFIKEQERTLTS